MEKTLGTQEAANLQGALLDHAKRTDQALALIQDKREFLCGPKFTGTDLDGERKDYINVRDVMGMLSELASALAEPKDWKIVRDPQENTVDVMTATAQTVAAAELCPCPMMTTIKQCSRHWKTGFTRNSATGPRWKPSGGWAHE